ncbi:anti-sigma factor [Neolewinella litorea]|uniref:Anti-sigma factor n=1 Tax=Neolewinella litorea TaxID=2562452 RepID=A0A4S4NAW4_9BACT|nr:anti-sigma factor [Neolewinella litorea]THH36504.1 anti-sigma factor [Neolewinella litorea]
MNHDQLQQFIRDHRDEFDGETPPAGLWDRIHAALSDDGREGQDPLSEFIVKNRDAFDNATPPPRIERQLFAPAPAARKPLRSRRFLNYVMAVAATLLLLMVAYTVGTRAGFRAGQEQQVAEQLEAMNPELAEAERFYRQRIASEFTKVSQLNDDPQLRRDLEQIDEATEELRLELLRVPISQRHVLVNQLIATYRTKLDILLRIQQHFPNPNAPVTPASDPNIPSHES